MTTTVNLTPAQLDRAAGVLVGMAAGDALGAGYEFETPPIEPKMIGGGLGPWDPGEWTDDTQMALCIAEVTASGRLDPGEVGERFLAWLRGAATDVGHQTRRVLGGARQSGELSDRAARHFEDHPRESAGNGSLMRTAPVALAYLGDDGAMIRAAMEISGLTHADPVAGEACVIWCVAIDRAVREGRLDGVRDGIDLLPDDRRQFWSERVDEAERNPPKSFTPNGYVVTALQAAYAAITQTAVPEEQPCGHLVDALEAAVRIGHDADTVAAIAGALLGARWGATAVPLEWKAKLHGWPEYRVADLVRLAVLTARGGRDDSLGWPSVDNLLRQYESDYRLSGVPIALSDDPEVFVGDVACLSALADGTSVVVSLCRVGRQDVPAGIEHHEVWLMDRADPCENPNLDWVLSDLASQMCRWRAEGRRVFVHCVRVESRTPTVAAAYLARHLGISGDDALARVTQQLPGCRPNPGFVAALSRLFPTDNGAASHAAARRLGPRFSEALVLAAALHREQTRKGNNIPYVAHLLAVCATVLEHGGDEDEAIAALLHDATEDQGGEPVLDVIERLFGPKVAEIVAECSDTFEHPKPPWRQRKEAYINALKSGEVSRSALLVSAADKLHNLTATVNDLRSQGDRFWSHFNSTADDQIWYYTSLSKIYCQRLGGPLADAVAEQVKRLIVETRQ
jgi:ADP-ribosylglycohydrolase